MVNTIDVDRNEKYNKYINDCKRRRKLMIRLSDMNHIYSYYNNKIYKENKIYRKVSAQKNAKVPKGD